MKTQKIVRSIRLPILGAAVLLATSFATSAQAQMTPVGKWRTIDDATGKAKSIVEISQIGDELKGKIIEIIAPDPAKPNPVCEKCEGDKKDKPILGFELLWGVKEEKPGVEWGGGKIQDPQNGKTYKVLLRPKDNGEKLEVRGYIGFSFAGRSQVWERVKDAAAKEAPAAAKDATKDTK